MVVAAFLVLAANDGSKVLFIFFPGFAIRGVVTGDFDGGFDGPARIAVTSALSFAVWFLVVRCALGIWRRLQ
jgi:hypothetical protein